ncbi:MAG: energy transducer TonB [Alistipes sp.]|nr:energy transducer TonB [Alistipes sp.]
MTDTAAGAPRPTDGYKAYYEYIYDRLAAAAGADGSKIGGVVVLSFTVDATGRPRDFKVVESPSPETAETLIRIIDSGPIWTRPGEVQAFAVTLR